MRWQLLDARTGVQLDHSSDLRVTPDVNTDAGSWNVWIPLPRAAHRMHVQVQLYNDRGQRADRAHPDQGLLARRLTH